MTKLGEGTTPGPWKVADEMHGVGNLLVAGVVKGRWPIANCGYDESGNAQANARLIAKAPLLVEARESIDDAIVNITVLHGELHDEDEFCVYCQWLRQARALLAKLEAEHE